MNRDVLENDVDQNLSIRKIAEKNSVSQGTVKHWLKKYNLKTNFLIGSKKEYGQYKFCPQCCQNCSISDFYKRGEKIGGYGWCKSCLNKITVQKQRETKQKCVDYKGGKCVICGYDNYIGALDFHHLEPGEKDFCISRVKNRKFEDIKKELDKCVLLCSTCHREVEGGVKKVGPVGLEPTTF